MTGGIYEQINGEFGGSCVYSLSALQQRIPQKDNASCSSFCSSKALPEQVHYWLIPNKVILVGEISDVSDGINLRALSPNNLDP